MKAIKPMLASSVTDLENLGYPVLVSPKLDGIRCIIVNGKAMSRRGKPIPNKEIQKLIGHHSLNGLDGELISGTPTAHDVFQASTSCVMSHGHSIKQLKFYVFDCFAPQLLAWPYVGRLPLARSAARATLPKKHYEIVESVVAHSSKDVIKIEKDFVKKGYEGIMIRDSQGGYKHGRSTNKQGWLMKLKRFTDSEGKILEIKQGKTNQNEKKKDAFGKMRRNGKKAGMKRLPIAGAIMVKDIKSGNIYKVSPGKATHAMRKQWWKEKDSMRGKIIKYRFQEAGTKDKPRFPRFIGFRDKRDM